VRSSRTFLRETHAFAADNLANLRREKENPGRFHRLATSHHKKHRQTGQAPASSAMRASIINNSRQHSQNSRHRARVLDRIEPIIEKHGAGRDSRRLRGMLRDGVVSFPALQRRNQLG
jgi:hypothetical protein